MGIKEKDTIYHRRPRKDDIHETPDVSYITNPDVAHEHSDVSVTPILKFVVGLFVFAVIVHALMWGLFKFFEAREIAAEPPPSPLARQGDERLPPDPRLQLAPGFEVRRDDGSRINLSQDAVKPEMRQPQSEYRVVHEMWQEKLNEYGWADEAAGAVRLPIKQAMEMYAARAQQQQQPQQQGVTTRPGETIPAQSSSGQTGERKNQ